MKGSEEIDYVKNLGKRSGVYCKKVFLKISQNMLELESPFNRVEVFSLELIKKETHVLVFLLEHYKVFQINSLQETSEVVSSDSYC